LYGVFKEDWAIIIANSVGCTLVGLLLVFKIRDTQRTIATVESD
jgi:hypothetical protein